MSEKKTDLWVFNELQAKGYTNAAMESKDEKVHVWAERSDMPMIDELFRSASKKKTGNQGIPEFIIFDEKSETIIVIENKKDPKFHIYSKDISEKTDKYAVNGVLWYALHIKDAYNVIAIACSGESPEDMLIDTFGWKKGFETFTNLNVHEILTIKDYRNLLGGKPDNDNVQNIHELLKSAKSINEFMHDKMNIIEHNRLYILGSILLALEDPVFKTGYSLYKGNRDISEFLWSTIERKLKSSQIVNEELFSSGLKPIIIGLKQEENKKLIGTYAKGTLHQLVLDVDRLLYKHYKDSELDLISLFFNTFLSYTTKGGSDLGIVLTPPHITKLFNEIAHTEVNSKILDICAGTGGFLTAGWRKIALSKTYSMEEKETFRKNNLYGVEMEPSIYIVTCLNMFLNKDGKSHIYNDDCFKLKKELMGKDCNVGFLNPPYSHKVYSEISFVELMLDCLLPGSIGIAIVPVNATSSRTKIHKDNNVYKRKILQKHSLIASIEMPKNLFFPKGTETVVLVFKTGTPNEGETWFAKFDDGYELIKHQKTRTPTAGSEEIIKTFLEDFDKKNITDHSFRKIVSAEEQWIYTLFSDNDYAISDADLQKVVNEYISYLFKNQYL